MQTTDTLKLFHLPHREKAALPQTTFRTMVPMRARTGSASVVQT